MARAWAGYTGGFSRVGGGQAQTEIGVPFVLPADTSATELSWFRPDLTAGMKPEILRLWRVADQTELGRVTTVPDDGSVGWQRANLPAPVALAANSVYCVSGAFQSGLGWPAPSSAWEILPAPFSYAGGFRRYHLPVGEWGFPANGDSGQGVGIDVLVGLSGEDVAPGPGGSGDPVATGDLADWLDTVRGTQAHSAPLKTVALASGATGFDAIKAVADAVAAAVSGLPGTIAGAIVSINGQTLTYLTAVEADLTSIINTGIEALTTLGTTVLDDASGNFGGASGALSGRSGFPTELWTLLDEGDFDGDVAITVAADLYALTFDTGSSGLVATPVAGVNWYPRAGWWCLLNGTFAAERHYFDFTNVHLQDQGRRMPGALIHCRAGCSGHWQAWALT